MLTAFCYPDGRKHRGANHARQEKNKISHHDHVFKAVLSDPAAARDLLEIHLPAQWRERCDLNNTDVRVFLEELRHKAPQREGELMTMAEQLIEEGMQKGIRQGSQEAAENIARNLLKNGMSVDFVHQMTQLPTETIEALKH